MWSRLEQHPVHTMVSDAQNINWSKETRNTLPRVQPDWPEVYRVPWGLLISTTGCTWRHAAPGWLWSSCGPGSAPPAESRRTGWALDSPAGTRWHRQGGMCQKKKKSSFTSALKSEHLNFISGRWVHFSPFDMKTIFNYNVYFSIVSQL